MTEITQQNSGDEFDAACAHDSEPNAWIEVSPETMKYLRALAKIKDCTVNVALEEAIREFDLSLPVTMAEVLEP